MMRNWLAAGLILLGCGSAAAGRIARGPYLENATSRTMTLRFRVEPATTAWLTYGAVPDCERFQTIVSPAKEERISLFGLAPDTTHCYRIYLPADQTSGVYKAFEGRFTTFRDEDKPYFSFMAFGESGSGSEEQAELAARINEQTPDFALHTGGLTESGLDTEADDQFFTPYSTALARLPFFYTLGTSEYGRDARKDAGKGFLKTNYTPFHSVPLTGLPPHFYFFDIANARFFVLDSNAFYGAKFAPGLTADSKQYKWLDSFLARADRKNSVGNPDKTWKFVVLHHPMYSTGPHEPDEDLLTTLEPLLLKHHVDLVFQGYNRNYERTKPVKEGLVDEAEGITYITLGGGGRALSVQARNEAWSDKYLPSYHFALAEVKDKHLQLTVYGKDGAVLDSFEIQK